MKNKLRVLKILKLISINSSVDIRRLDVLVRTKYAQIDDKALSFDIDLPNLLQSMLEENLITKNPNYQITESGLKYLEQHSK